MNEHMGRYPTRAELFEKCCYPSDGSSMSEAVREAIEKMKELATENDGYSSDCEAVHDPDDVFAKIMGKDKDGRLRMYGMGVKPTDIYGGKPSRDALSKKSMEDKEEIRVLKLQVQELKALVNSRSHSERAHITSGNNQSSSGISRPARIRVGAYVQLKSLDNFSETVAIGILRAIGGVIHNGRDLGPRVCEVVVQTVLKGEEMLIYPLELIESIRDSIGVPIAWPLSLVSSCLLIF